MAKAREDLVKEKHQLKEELGVVEMRLDGALEKNKMLTEEKGTLEQNLHNTGKLVLKFSLGDPSIFPVKIVVTHF